MKCFNHRITDAIAVCACCGRALCPDCVPSPAPARIVCSPACAANLERNEAALQRLLQKSLESARASAFYCYLSAGLSAAAAVGAWLMLPSPFLIYFTGGCALVLFAAGIWYGRGAKK
jgi:hypothetical protein